MECTSIKPHSYSVAGRTTAPTLISILSYGARLHFPLCLSIWANIAACFEVVVLPGDLPYKAITTLMCLTLRQVEEWPKVALILILDACEYVVVQDKGRQDGRWNYCGSVNCKITRSFWVIPWAECNPKDLYVLVRRQCQSVPGMRKIQPILKIKQGLYSQGSHVKLGKTRWEIPPLGASKKEHNPIDTCLGLLTSRTRRQQACCFQQLNLL